MKKILFMLLAMMLLASGSVSAAGIEECGGNEVKLQIGNPVMNACGMIKEIDEGRGTAPIIDNDTTLVPARAVIEAFGGYISWDEESRAVYVNLRGKSSKVTIDSTEAVVYTDDVEEIVSLATAPKIINDRTMLPLRFISESVGLLVDWNGDEKVITVSQPKSQPVKFANVEGEFYPIGDLFDIHMDANDTTEYSYGGKKYEIKTNINNLEDIDWSMVEYNDYDTEVSISSISVDGTEYHIPNVFNLEYVGVADISSGADGFEIVVVDSGLSDDYTVTVFTYNQYGLVWTNIYEGMTYEFYTNGTGTVYCDKIGNIINQYIGFTDPMYAFRIDTIKGGDGNVPLEGEVTVLEPDVVGKEMVFGIDLFAYYFEVEEYPADFYDAWNMQGELKTVNKGTSVIIDEIKYWYDEETGERSVLGYYARVDGKKCVIHLHYAG